MSANRQQRSMANATSGSARRSSIMDETPSTMSGEGDETSAAAIGISGATVFSSDSLLQTLTRQLADNGAAIGISEATAATSGSGRLDHIFEMLALLDNNDESALRRFEHELLRSEDQDHEVQARNMERAIDNRILRDLNALHPTSTSVSGQEELEAYLSILQRAGGTSAPTMLSTALASSRATTGGSASSAMANVGTSMLLPLPPLVHNGDESTSERGDVDDDEQFALGDDIEHEDEDDHELLALPSGTTLSPMHIDVIHRALLAARTALHLSISDEELEAAVNQNRGRSRVPRSDRAPTQSPSADRRGSNASEPDRERDTPPEQIEGYEGDRIERQNPELSAAHDGRISQIMEILRALSAAEIGTEEIDDFVLQSVLHFHSGPSRDSGGARDNIGDEQMVMYQECIAVIDDFLDILALAQDADDNGIEEDDEMENEFDEL